MTAPLNLIIKDRQRLQNPCAHLDDEGEFSADIPSQLAATNINKDQADIAAANGGPRHPYEVLADQIDDDEIKMPPSLNAYPGIPATTYESKELHEGYKGSLNRYAVAANQEEDEFLSVGGNNKQNAPLPLLQFNQLVTDSKGKISYKHIEEAARQLAHAIWHQKEALWPDGVPDDPAELLNPEKAFELLGYKVSKRSSLGVIEGDIDVAGIIDKDNRTAELSLLMPPEIMNFTAAHEVGHAIMHQQSGLHRDKPLDGSSTVPRDHIELEADKFAVYFLMPAKLVTIRFNARFPEEVLLRDNLQYLLNSSNDKRIEKELSTKRGLARALAGLDRINGEAVFSLAEQFKVSREAMAIRLEELGLIPEY